MPKVSSKGKTSGAGAERDQISATDLEHNYFADEFTYSDLYGCIAVLAGSKNQCLNCLNFSVLLFLFVTIYIIKYMRNHPVWAGK